MEVFGKDNKYITTVFDPTQDDISKIPHQLIKDIVFVDSKKYKYHPSFTRIYYISPDYKQTNVISLFEELEKEKTNLDNPQFTRGFFEYIAKQYNLQQAVINDLLEIVKNTGRKQEIIDNIMKSYPQFKQNIDNYYKPNLLSPTGAREKPETVEDDWGSSTSSENIVEYSKSPRSSRSSTEDIFESLDKEKTVEKDTEHPFFDIYLRYFYIILTKKNISSGVKYEEFYTDFVLDNNFIAIGMHLEGTSKYRVMKTEDKVISKRIHNFTYSEHNITKTKSLNPDIFYFLYHIDKDIYISGELRQDLRIVLKVNFNEDYKLEDIGEIEQKINIHSYKILEKLKKKVPNLVENLDRNIVKISIKIKHKIGKIDRNILKNTFLLNLKETHKGSILRFDLILDEKTTLKEIIYSEKGGFSNFTIKDIPDKTYIPDIINKISYPFQEQTSIKKPEKIELKKEKIKSLASLNIPYDSRKCQKDRRIEILNEGESYEDDRVLNYKGNLLVCRSNLYPYPGETKTGIPCCFKRIQKSKTEDYESTDIIKTFDLRPLLKEKEELIHLRREGIDNPLLQDIFPIDEGFYALTLSSSKIGIPEVLEKLYGEDVISKSFEYLKEEDSKYLDIDKNDDIKNIVKAVSLYKENNILVVSYNNRDFSFVCSMSEYMIFDKFIIILFRNDNYKILIKSNEGSKQFGWVFSKTNKELQRLIKAYNSSCLGIKDCKENIPDLKKILSDRILEIGWGVVDPITNKIIYLETDKGLVTIKPSKISYSIKTKQLKDIKKISYEDQINKLKEIENFYSYLETEGKVYNEDKSKITGIKTRCNIIIPVLDEEIKDTSDEIIEDDVFDIDIYSKLKQEIISGEELDAYNENFIDNYKEITLKTIKNYYNENVEERNNLIKLIDEGNFEDLLKNLIKLFVIRDDIEIPVEDSTTFPIPIKNEHTTDVLSYITWVLMNNSEEFFTEDFKSDKTQVDVSLIPNLEEVVVNGDDLF